MDAERPYTVETTYTALLSLDRAELAADPDGLMAKTWEQVQVAVWRMHGVVAPVEPVEAPTYASLDLFPDRVQVTYRVRVKDAE